MTRIRALLRCGICWMARDLSRARAILIGNAVFQDPRIDDLPAAAGCVTEMAELLAGELCGWPAGRIVRLENLDKPDVLARRVITAVRDAEDVLLVYYTGHGYRTRNGQLALALGQTDPDPETLPHTAMLYESLADILRGCRAATKLVILDCCHAELGGRANYVFQGSDLAEVYPVDGLYFIGASKRDQNAKSPRDGQLTYFTQALVDVVRGGIPGQPEELRLDQIFLEVRARLVRARLPEPVDSGIRGARQYPFARNAAWPASTAQALETSASALAAGTRRRRLLAALIAGAAALVAAAVILVDVASAPHGQASGSRGSAAIVARVYSDASYGFNAPNRVATGGDPNRVPNPRSNPRKELNASDGSPVRILTGASYRFSRPYAIALDRTHFWVANANGSSVTELNASDGSPVRILTGAAYSNPTAIADDGTHVWVANAAANSVTELNVSDGSLLRTLDSASNGFYGPRAVVLDGTHVWIANASGNSVTELDASNGSWVTTLAGARYGFSGPWGIAADGAHIWVTNSGGNTVTELTTG